MRRSRLRLGSATFDGATTTLSAKMMQIDLDWP